MLRIQEFQMRDNIHDFEMQKFCLLFAQLWVLVLLFSNGKIGPPFREWGG